MQHPLVDGEEQLEERPVQLHPLAVQFALGPSDVMRG